MYEFTDEGYYIAWLIEAKCQEDEKDKVAANLKIIEILENYYNRYHSALSIAFTRFLQRCRSNLDRDKSLVNNIGFVREILPSRVRTLENKNKILLMISADKPLSEIFLDAINELDEETRKLVFFQIKSDIESSIEATMHVTKE